MKRLIVIAVAVALLLNFIWFLLSLWPYQKLAKLETVPDAQGKAVRIESPVNKEIYKANAKKYVAINVGTIIVGLSATFLLRRTD